MFAIGIIFAFGAYTLAAFYVGGMALANSDAFSTAPWWTIPGYVALQAVAPVAFAFIFVLASWSYYLAFAQLQLRWIFSSWLFYGSIFVAVYWSDAEVLKPILLVISAIHIASLLAVHGLRWWLKRLPPEQHLVDAPRSSLVPSLLRYPLAQASLTLSAARLVFDFLVLSLATLGAAATFFAIGMLTTGHLPGSIAAAFLIILARPRIASAAIRAGRRFRIRNARTASNLFAVDRRPGLLFLRSFLDDSVVVSRSRSMPEYVLGVPKKLPQRLEESLVDVAFRFGPVAALSDPSAGLPMLGAARDVSSNDQWQNYVMNKLGECEDVVLVIGQTEGLKWEMSVIRDHDLMGKLIIVIPPGRNSSAAEIREMVPKAFHVPAFKDKKALLLCRLPTGGWWLIVAENDDAAAYEEAALLALQLRRGDRQSSRRASIPVTAQAVGDR